MVFVGPAGSREPSAFGVEPFPPSQIWFLCDQHQGQSSEVIRTMLEQHVDPVRDSCHLHHLVTASTGEVNLGVWMGH